MGNNCPMFSPILFIIHYAATHKLPDTYPSLWNYLGFLLTMYAHMNIELEIVWVARTQITVEFSPKLLWVTLFMYMMWCKVISSTFWMRKANSHVGLSEVLTNADMTCGKLLTRLNYFVSNHMTPYDTCSCDLVRGTPIPNSHTITNVGQVDYLLGYIVGLR